MLNQTTNSNNDQIADTGCWYLVSESKRVWSNALRSTLRNCGLETAASRVHTREGDLTMPRVTQSDHPIIFAVEISRENLSRRLQELASLGNNHRHCTVACVDRRLAQSDGPNFNISKLEQLLLETGAAIVLWSPRQISLLVEIASRHAAAAANAPSIQFEESDPTWRQLPWQQAPWAIG